MSYPWRGVQSRRSRHIGQEIVKYAAIFIDVLAITSTQTAAFVGRFGGQRNFQDYYVMALAAVCVLYLLFRTASLYEFEVIIGWPRWSGMLLMMTAAVSLIFGALLYLANVGADFPLGADFPRSWFLTTFIGSAFVIWAMRGALAAVVRHQARRGALTRSVAVFGAGLQGKQLVEHLRTETAGGKRVVGVFDDRATIWAGKARLPPWQLSTWVQCWLATSCRISTRRMVLDTCNSTLRAAAQIRRKWTACA